MERLYRTATALEECEAHLEAAGVEGGTIEYFLAQYVAVGLCSEMEQRLIESAEHRVSQSKDDMLASYVGKMLKQKKGWYGLKKTDISEFLRLFGDSVKDKFNAELDDRKVTQYNNAVEARHSVAHRGGSNLTLSEVRGATDVAEEILGLVDKVLEG